MVPGADSFLYPLETVLSWASELNLFEQVIITSEIFSVEMPAGMYAVETFVELKRSAIEALRGFSRTAFTSKISLDIKLISEKYTNI